MGSLHQPEVSDSSPWSEKNHVGIGALSREMALQCMNIDLVRPQYGYRTPGEKIKKYNIYIYIYIQKIILYIPYNFPTKRIRMNPLRLLVPFLVYCLWYGFYVRLKICTICFLENLFNMYKLKMQNPITSKDSCAEGLSKITFLPPRGKGKVCVDSTLLRSPPMQLH